MKSFLLEYCIPTFYIKDLDDCNYKCEAKRIEFGLKEIER